MQRRIDPPWGTKKDIDKSGIRTHATLRYEKTRSEQVSRSLSHTP